MFRRLTTQQAAEHSSDYGQIEMLTVDTNIQTISTNKAAEGPLELSSCSMSARHTSDPSGLRHQSNLEETG